MFLCTNILLENSGDTGGFKMFGFIMVKAIFTYWYILIYVCVWMKYLG